VRGAKHPNAASVIKHKLAAFRGVGPDTHRAMELCLEKRHSATAGRHSGSGSIRQKPRSASAPQMM